MEETNCPICCYDFNPVENRAPIRCPKCAKRTCTGCLSRIYEEQGFIKCPSCQDMRLIDPSSLEASIHSLVHPCANHQMRESASIDILTMDFLCAECADESSDSNIKALGGNAMFYLKKRFKNILNDTGMKLPNNLIVQALNLSKQMTEFSDLRNLIKEILRLKENKMNCSVHRENKCTKIVDDDSKSLLCDSCETNNPLVYSIFEWVSGYFNYICRHFDLCNLLPFFVKKKRDIAKNIISLEQDIDRETSMWISQIIEQFQIKPGETRFPGLYTKCPDCYQNFSVGRKLPVLLPCQSRPEDPKHYVCYDCWERMVFYKRFFCILDDKKMIGDFPTQFIEYQWLNLNSLNCTECDFGILRREKFYFLPCNHMICSSCVEEGLFRCKLCDIKFPSNTQFEENLVSEHIQSYFYLKCYKHSLRATKIDLLNFKVFCERCSHKNGIIPINLSQIHKRIDTKFEEIIENQPGVLIYFKLMNKAPLVPLMDKIRLITGYREPFTYRLSENLVWIMRFKEICPKKIESIRKAWVSRDGQCDSVIVRVHGNAQKLRGLILGGPLKSSFVEVAVKIQLFDGSFPLCTSYSLTEKENPVRFNCIDIQSGFYIHVYYPGSDHYYNGVPSSHVEEFRTDDAIFEIIEPSRDSDNYRNYRGGPILGWIIRN